MAKIQKKGQKGAAANYITRTKAVRKLQISLAEFRRLCILKGIYPRDPKNKKKASGRNNANNTFYYTKDINYLLHEPVLAKFRERKAFLRKLAKAIGKHQLSTAKSLEESLPTYSLDHIVKERYPSFMDALRDLDDCLCHVFLFATLPATEHVDQKRIESCQRLAAEFLNYVVMSNGLQKSFLSIKGIYYQAEIKGQPIVWLVPYQFGQNIPVDVDFRVMSTFLEFYETMLGFINFRLYSELGLQYPPMVNARLEDRGAGYLAALQAQFKGRNKLVRTPRPTVVADSSVLEEKLATLEGKLKDIQEQASTNVDDQMAEEVDQPETDDAKEDQRLMSDKIVFISREIPRSSVEFVLRSLGATVCWPRTSGKGSPFEENHPGITHHIVDRPVESMNLHASRSYVQPQWVFDCLNAGKVLAENEYMPGKKLPSHLSPFKPYEDDEDDPASEQEIEENITKVSVEEEKKQLVKMMMSNKKRKLLERIETKQAHEATEAAKIRAKRKAISK